MVRQETIGQRIREQRISCEMSQSQLAFPELSDSYISLIESGRRVPGPAVVDLLARKLGCSASYLVSGVDEKTEGTLRTTLSYAQIALDNGAAEEARERFAEVLEHPDLPFLPELRRDARWGHALALEASGSLEDAVRELESLGETYSPEYEQDQWVALHIALCRCHRERGDLIASVRVGEEALHHLTSSGHKWTDSMIELGATVLAAYQERGDLYCAQRLVDRLIEQAEAANSSRARVAAYWEAGLVAEARGDYREELRLIERALAILGEEEPGRNLPRLRMVYGGALLRAHPERAEQALDVLRQAERELEESAAGAVDVAWCVTEAARAELVLERPAEALALAQRATELLGDEPRLATAVALTVLGEAHVRLGRQDDAAEALCRAAAQLEGMSASRQAAQAWFDLAQLLGETGAEDRRADAYHRALACAGL
jgi:tetratricopeptide (TPR) repeat protein